MSVRCQDFAAVRLQRVEQSRTVSRRALRCPRSACKGQLYLESDLGGHILESRCLLCGRTARHYTATDLVERHGMDWRDLDKACVQTLPLLWNRTVRDVAH